MRLQLVKKFGGRIGGILLGWFVASTSVSTIVGNDSDLAIAADLVMGIVGAVLGYKIVASSQRAKEGWGRGSPLVEKLRGRVIGLLVGGASATFLFRDLVSYDPDLTEGAAGFTATMLGAVIGYMVGAKGDWAREDGGKVYVGGRIGGLFLGWLVAIICVHVIGGDDPDLMNGAVGWSAAIVGAVIGYMIGEYVDRQPRDDGGLAQKFAGRALCSVVGGALGVVVMELITGGDPDLMNGAPGWTGTMVGVAVGFILGTYVDKSTKDGGTGVDGWWDSSGTGDGSWWDGDGGDGGGGDGGGGGGGGGGDGGGD